MTFAVMRAMFLFQSPKLLLQQSLLVGLITATLLFITASKNILKLEYVQNCLARVVTLSPRFPILSFHWLPVKYRIISKLYTIAYQTLSSGELSCLFSMLSLTRNPREHRSCGFYLLSIPRVTTHAGTRTVSVAVPTLWNSFTI